MYDSTKKTLPNANEILAARDIVTKDKASRPAAKRKRRRDEDNTADVDDETEEPARKKGAVNTALRVANETELRGLMMN